MRTIHLLTACAALGLALLAFGGQSFRVTGAMACEAPPGGAVVVNNVTRDPAVAIDRSLDRPQLMDLSLRLERGDDYVSTEAYRTDDPDRPYGEWVINGLTPVEFNDASSVRMHTVRMRDGRHCVQGVEADINLFYSSPIPVFIVSRYPEGSCEYGVLHEHEMRHVEIYKDVMDEWREKGARRARRVFVEDVGFPFVADDPDAALETLRLELVDVVRYAFDGVKRDGASRNAPLDTKEAYLADAARCDGWDRPATAAEALRVLEDAVGGTGGEVVRTIVVPGGGS